MRNALMTKLLVITLASIALAGCVDDSSTDGTAGTDSAPIQVAPDMAATTPAPTIVTSMFEESVVNTAADRTGDLYEPTIEVCDDGSIYITGHTIAVDTTGAPVFGSHDDGETWAQLPWFQDQQFPGRQVQGATPPVSDEIFLACGDDGWLYGSDITLASYPVNAWSEHGTQHSYWNFNAYDETKVAQQTSIDPTQLEVDFDPTAFDPTNFTTYPQVRDGGAVECAPVPAKDRPWSAYAGGKLLLTSNPAGGPNQIGVVDVPFDNPSPWSLGSVVDGIEWNLCAGPGGSIPGIPDIREDGLIAAPQISGGTLHVTLGNADDIMGLEYKPVFDVTNIGQITSHYGHSIFDGEGDLFVGIGNNTRQTECRTVPDEFGEPTQSCSTSVKSGGFIISASTDDGETFVQTNFTTEKPLRHFYMDSNEEGPGALVVWATEDNETGYDWFVGHVQIDNETGAPYLDVVTQAIDNGPAPSAHVTGAAVGPDGRTYLAMYTTRAGSPDAPTWPLSVYIQRDGPTLPVTAASDAE